MSWPGRGSGPSHRPPARASQMSQQAEVIARKKAEIEAKLKRIQEGEGQDPPGVSSSSSAGSEEHYQSLKSVSASVSASASASASAAAAKKFGKNRWGFKGKQTNSSVPAGATPPTPVVKFTNDGSFLEQFKKLQQEQQVIKQEDDPHLALRPTPPKRPSPCGPPSASTSSSDPQPSKQEQEWYLEALSKARKIAKTVVKSPEVESDAVAVPGAGEACAVAGAPQSPDVKTENPSTSASVELPTVANELASLVAVSGDAVEVMARERNLEEQQLLFLQDKECELYKQYRRRVDQLRAGFKDENTRVRKKASRWGSEADKVVPFSQAQQASDLSGKSPQLVAYAMRVFGSSDLEPHQWKQCEDQMKMSLVYQDLLAKQQKMEKMAQQGKRQYEYDSDEDVDGGTWEHKARKLEMEKTATEAAKLTEQAAGKHHIGDFLPPEELSKFLKKYEAVKNGEAFEESDYQDSKLDKSNLGFKMLQKMGWSEGSGLGASSQGITNPINQGTQSSDKKGLGVSKPHDVSQEDDEFDAYRKRMMLAYRFRPNPLNNPRRAYY